MQFRLRMLFLLCILLWSSLNVFSVGCGVAVFAAGIASAFFIRWSERLWVAAILMTLISFVWMVAMLNPEVRAVGFSAAPHALCKANMKRIVMALHNYYQDNNCFPPVYIADKNGRPMHSWRALILPYLDDTLAKQYNFKEPWDGPSNKKLCLSASTRGPSPADYYFACPSDYRAGPGGVVYTNYLAVVGPHSAWRGAKSMKDISGPSQTILLVEVASSDVAWTEPRDFDATTASSPNPPMTISSKHPPKLDFCPFSDR